jgi:putative ABC transport system permease protein
MPLGVIGIVFVLPLAIPPLLRLVAVVLEWALGFEGRLAMRQLERRPTRTSLTVGTLSIAIFIAIGVGNGLNASVRDIRGWINRVATADFYLRGSQPDGAYAITMSVLPEKLEAELARLDGVARVDKVNWILARAHDQRVVVLACTVPPEGPLSVDLAEGDPEEVRRGLLQGGTVLGTALAQRLKLRVGDEIVLETRGGPRPLRIVGLANEYTIDGMALFVEWHAAQRHLPMEGVHVFGISAHEGKTALVAEGLTRLSRERELLLQSQGELRQYIDQAVLGIFGMVWGLLGTIFVVASLGIVNTLTMNVLEQTRELGMLRAIGLQRRQLRKLIMAQALAVGLMSVVPGTLIGLALAYVIHVFSNILLAHKWEFQIDLILIAGCLAAALAITLLAALAPARRAARLQVVQALQVE